MPQVNRYRLTNICQLPARPPPATYMYNRLSKLIFFWCSDILQYLCSQQVPSGFFFCNWVNTCSWSFAAMCRRASKFSRNPNTFFGPRTVFCRDNINHDLMLCLIHTHTARIPSFDSLNDFCFGHACWLRQVVALFRKINGQSLELGCWNGQ